MSETDPEDAPPATVDPRWYESFFEGLAAEIWRRALPAGRTRAECDFVADLLDLDVGERVLDVPCGEGRIALELARRGYRASGVDLSKTAIAAARTAARRQGLAVTLRCADMRALPWRGAFRGACCLGNAFGYLDRGGSVAFLRAVAGALAPGGRFLLHSAMAAESLLPHLESEMTIAVGDLEMHAENRYDALAGRLDTRYRFTRGAAREERVAAHWIFSVAEIVRMLAEAGLATRELAGSTEGDDFEVGAPELYLLAEKQ